MKNIKTALSFDDVLLVPRRNEVRSRRDVDISTTICSQELSIPILAANMPTVCGPEMASALGNLGAMGVMHRMCSPDQAVDNVKRARSQTDGLIGASVGIDDNAFDVAQLLYSAGADIICVDVAHGHQPRVERLVVELLKRDIPTIAGNYATGEAVSDLVDYVTREKLPTYFLAVKVGVGGGSLCSTRVQTGCGIPTLASVLSIDNPPEGGVIADGGIKSAGDIVKALAAGSNAVMLGGLLAGTDEAPGEIFGGRKVFAGNASEVEKLSYFGEASFVEGESTLVNCKGPVHLTIKKLTEGLRSGMTYQGVDRISGLFGSSFVQVTSAGRAESLPHGKN